jgi:hypothetical protein
MPFPIKVCVICKEEFELRPDKPGFANRCPDCTAEEAETGRATTGGIDKSDADLNEARRNAIRDMLYRRSD